LEKNVCKTEQNSKQIGKKKPVKINYNIIQKKSSWYTTVGLLSIVEKCFIRSGLFFRPFSYLACVKSRNLSQLLQRAVVDFGADSSFAKAKEKLKERYRIEVAVSAIRLGKSKISCVNYPRF
jgi:hypothetical protein